jgi:hypothetical protein
MIALTEQTLGRIVTKCDEGLRLESLSNYDWESLIAYASAEGMSPSIYWTLVRSGQFGSLPEFVRHSLASAYAVTLFQNESVIAELEILAVRCQQAGIPVVLLKGVSFALTIYADIGLRPMGDMDLLVPAERLQEAVEFAKAEGFTESLPEAAPGIDEMLSLHVRLQKPGPRPLTLEVHDGLVGGRYFTYAVPVDWFWSQTEPLTPARETLPSVRVLTPTAQLLYAAAHAMLQHGGRGAPLRWFLDMHLLIEHYADRLDWELLLSQAQSFEWGSALAAALAHTRATFGTPIPERVLSRLADVSDRHEVLVAHLQSTPATRVLEERERLVGMSWYGRTRVVLALVFPTPSYMRWRYQLRSPWSLPAAYLTRWWGIVTDGLRTLTVIVRR